MSDQIKTAISDLLDNKPANFKNTINDVILDKAQVQIDQIRNTMASSWLNDPATDEVEAEPEVSAEPNAEQETEDEAV